VRKGCAVTRVVKYRKVIGGKAGRSTNGRNEKYKLSVGKPDGKRQFEGHRCRWKDNIKMSLKGTVQECTGVISLRIG
jgi:hypothetical protein